MLPFVVSANACPLGITGFAELIKSSDGLAARAGGADFGRHVGFFKVLKPKDFCLKLVK